MIDRKDTWYTNDWLTESYSCAETRALMMRWKMRSMCWNRHACIHVSIQIQIYIQFAVSSCPKQLVTERIIKINVDHCDLPTLSVETCRFEILKGWNQLLPVIDLVMVIAKHSFFGTAIVIKTYCKTPSNCSFQQAHLRISASLNYAPRSHCD